MDWVWTDTTLSLSSWICVEDVYAHCFVLKCWRESEKVPEPCFCLSLPVRYSRVLLSSEVPSASWPEEEAGGEVRDGWPDRSAADLYRLVSASLHVAHQICGRRGEPAPGHLSDHHAGRLPGTLTWTDAALSAPLRVAHL